MFSDNLKATWKLIGTIINRKKAQHGTLIQKLLYKGKCYNDKASICHQLNTHFINVGRDLAAQLPNYNITPTNFIRRRFQFYVPRYIRSRSSRCIDWAKTK